MAREYSEKSLQSMGTRKLGFLYMQVYERFYGLTAKTVQSREHQRESSQLESQLEVFCEALKMREFKERLDIWHTIRNTIQRLKGKNYPRKEEMAEAMLQDYGSKILD